MSNRDWHDLWESLRGKFPQLDSPLVSVRIRQLRGIEDLKVNFKYPVSVLAGKNGCGKTTVLLATACAYKDPKKDNTDNHPDQFFATYEVVTGENISKPTHCEIETRVKVSSNSYLTQVWRRDIRRNRKAGKHRKMEQNLRKLELQRNEAIEKCMFLRIIPNLADIVNNQQRIDDSEEKHRPTEECFPDESFQLAQSIDAQLKYSMVWMHRDSEGDILIASRLDKAQYAESDMAGGERLLLRLGHDISGLKNSLVLIDEVEAGLYPRAQQMLMWHLQQLALRNSLQIIVTTHSPVILDCVPPEARIFLRRGHDHDVRVEDAYPDIIQDVLYGRPQRCLTLLCEDGAAAKLVDGILDVVVPDKDWSRDAIQARFGNGVSKFRIYAEILTECDMLSDFVFVVDGDQIDGDELARLREIEGCSIISLPGECPEQWIWEYLAANIGDLAESFGYSASSLVDIWQEIDSKHRRGKKIRGDRWKNMLDLFGRRISCSTSDICKRIVAHALRSGDKELKQFAHDLEAEYESWRKRMSIARLG